MSEKKNLTKRQRSILEFIHQTVEEDRRPPTIREIGGALDISSTSVVNYNLDRLKERGYLDREEAVSRGLRLTEAAFELLGVAQEKMSSVSQQIAQGIQNLVRVPIVGNIVAGEPIDVTSDFAIYDEEDLVELSGSMLPNRTDDLFALRVDGNSMVEDMINDGDIVIMRRAETARDGEMVAAWVEGEGTTLKRIYRDNGRIRLQPSNPYMEPIYAPVEDVRVQGKVIWVLRNTQ